MGSALPAVGLCLVFLPVEAALLPFGGWLADGRIDAALCAVLWLAVGPAGVVEGAIGAFACGALADVFYAVHPGLFTLLAMALYALARVGAGALEVRGSAGFAVLCGLGTLAEAALARGLLAVVGRAAPVLSWGALAWTTVLTAAAGAAFFQLLGGMAHALEREDPSLLR